MHDLLNILYFCHNKTYFSMKQNIKRFRILSLVDYVFVILILPEDWEQNECKKFCSRRICFFFSKKTSLFGIFRPTREFFTHMETVIITGENLQILTYMYVRHSWPLNSEDSLACHTCCDMGHPCIIWGLVPLTPIAERSAVELSLHVFMT